MAAGLSTRKLQQAGDASIVAMAPAEAPVMAMVPAPDAAPEPSMSPTPVMGPAPAVGPAWTPSMEPSMSPMQAPTLAPDMAPAPGQKAAFPAVMPGPSLGHDCITSPLPLHCKHWVAARANENLYAGESSCRLATCKIQDQECTGPTMSSNALPLGPACSKRPLCQCQSTLEHFLTWLLIVQAWTQPQGCPCASCSRQAVRGPCPWRLPRLQPWQWPRPR